MSDVKTIELCLNYATPNTAENMNMAQQFQEETVKNLMIVLEDLDREDDAQNLLDWYEENKPLSSRVHVAYLDSLEKKVIES